jgi:hypothetical protein
MLTSFGTLSAAGQERPKREGFWMGFGFGYGSAKVSCATCEGGRDGSFAGNLRFGGTLGPRLLLGGAVNGWGRQDDKETTSLGNISGVVTFYPRERSGFFVEGGIGASSATFETVVATAEGPIGELAFTETTKGVGWGLAAGVGFDLRIRRNISLVPSAHVYVGRPGDLEYAGRPVMRDFSQNIFDITLGVTFH